MRYRIEKDALGEKIIPQEAYYGINTLRSKETFEIAKHGICRQNIKALANIKKAQAQTNFDFGFLSKEKCDAICMSCEELLNGRLHGQFITDAIQDGYGYGMEANAVEVIANRANEMLGADKGTYQQLKLEEVAMFESIDEVVTIAGKIAAIRLIKKLETEGKKLANSYKDLVVDQKISSTDLGNQLEAMGAILSKDIKQLDKALTSLRDIDFGKNLPEGTDKGKYLESFVRYLNISAIEKFTEAKFSYETNNSLEGFMNVSSILKNMMVNLSKCAVDLKVLIKNDKLDLKPVELMGIEDENTIVLDAVKQISFYIGGNDMTIARCIEAGELGTNIYKPMIYGCLFESTNLVRRTIRTIREKVIENLKVK